MAYDALGLDRRLCHLDLLSRFSTGEETLLDVLCDFIFQSFRGVIPFDRLGVALLEGEPAIVRARWQRSVLPGPSLPEGYSLPLAATTLGETVESGQPRIINDLGTYLRLRPESASTRAVLSHGVQSSLTCPLISRGEAVGFLFFSSSSPHTYTGHHLRLFEHIAQDLSFVIEHTAGANAVDAQAVTRLGAALESLTRSVAVGQQEALLLARITEKINAGLGLRQTLGFIYDEFRDILPYDRVSFALLDDHSQAMSVCWARSEDGAVVFDEGASEPLENGGLGDVLRSGTPRAVGDLEVHLLDYPESEATRRILREGFRSSLTCPLVAMGRPVGFLSFSSRAADVYRGAHVERFTRLAGQLAVIIEKGRLYEQLDREHRCNDRLLRELMPGVIVDELQAGRKPQAELHPECTVVMADLVGFTSKCQSCTPRSLQSLLDDLYDTLDQHTQRLGVTKIGTIGDAYLAVAGVPTSQADHQLRAVRLAEAIHQTLTGFRWPDGSPVQARVGICSGPVISGLVGRHARRFDIWGHTVNMASRLQAESEPGRTMSCCCIAGELPDEVRIDPAGRRLLKGVGEVDTAWISIG